MAGFNKVILLGNLTRDPQLRYLPSNIAVCDVGLAVSRRFRDRDGNQKEETCFVDCTAWGKSAETINQYMAKGRPLLVEGRLKLDQWTGQDGQKRSKLTVVIENFQFVGGRPDGAGPGAPGGAPAHQAEPPRGEDYHDAPGADESGPPAPEQIPF